MDIKKQRLAVIRKIGEIEDGYCEPCDREAVNVLQKCRGCVHFEKIRLLGQKLNNIANKDESYPYRIKDGTRVSKLHLTPKEFARLKVIEKLTHKEIARLKGVHPSSITKWKARNKEAVEKNILKMQDAHKGA